MTSDRERKISVLFINLYTEMGGGEYAIYNLLKHLDRSRFRPVMMFNTRGPFVERVESLGIEIVIIPFAAVQLKSLIYPKYALQNMRASRRIQAYLNHAGIDVIHASDVLSLFLIAWPKLRLRIPVVYDVIFFYEWARIILFNLLALLLVKQIVVHSQAVKDELVRRTVLLRQKIDLVYYGVDLSHFKPSSNRRETAFRKELGVSPTTKLVGMVARFDTWKGHLTFLDAADQIHRSRDDVVFLIVGGAMTEIAVPKVARYRLRVLTHIHEMNYGDSLQLLGHRDDIQDVMSSLDVLVCPSDYEPFGLVVIEALACGVPVVASSTVGGLEVLKDVNGLFVTEPKNSFSMATKISEALDCDLMSSTIPFGMNALKILTWDKYTNWFKACYQLLHNPPKSITYTS